MNKQYCRSQPRCKYFVSWYEFMSDDDPLEPDDCGKCDKEENQQDGEEMAVYEDTEICKYYEVRRKR